MPEHAGSPGPFAAVDSGVRVAVRVQPGAARSAVEGVTRLADGALVLKARVAAPPEGGRANAALVKLLAKTWQLPKGTIAIASGAKDRRKTLLVAGEPAALLARLRDWLAALEPGAGR